jgi:hypothetical protein
MAAGTRGEGQSRRLSNSRAAYPFRLPDRRPSQHSRTVQGASLQGAAEVSVPNRDFMHLSAVRAIDVDNRAPRCTETLYVRLDIGGHLVTSCRTEKVQRRCHNGPPCSGGSTTNSQPPGAWLMAAADDSITRAAPQRNRADERRRSSSAPASRSGGGGMVSNHRLVLFTHALCRLSHPAKVVRASI